MPTPALRLTHRQAAICGALLALAACGAAACGSSATAITSPTTLTRCGVSVTGGGAVPAQGGAGTVTVAAARECSWTASVDGAWLNIRSGVQGQGNGTVEFAAVSNPDPVVRRGALVLNDQRLEVTQAAGECAISLGDGTETFPLAGGKGRVQVRSSSSLCAWRAESDAPWIVLTSGPTGSGGGEISFDVLPATGPARSGTVSVSGQRFTISQSAQTDGCQYTISPGSHAADPGGSSGSIAIATAPSCPWTAVSQTAWLTLGPASGSGPGTVTFRVEAASNSRTGTAVVAGQTFAVSQGGGSSLCTFAVAPQTHTVAAAGGTVTVTVTVGASCAWSASSDVSWSPLAGPSLLVGNSATSFAVAANSGSARVATVLVADQRVIINQSAAPPSPSPAPAPPPTPAPTPTCAFAISPEQRNIEASGGSFEVAVSTTSGCAWTAASQVSWLSVRERDTGRAEVIVAANTGAARSGSATVAGRTLTVNQSAAAATLCRYDIRPRQRTVGAGERRLRIQVETSSRDCGWSASSTVPWVRVDGAASGAGDGEVTLLVLANRDDDRRRGTITIAGETLTIQQKARGDDDDDDDDDD